MPQGVALFVPASAGEPDPGLPRRADRHPVEPGAQQVGVADGEGLAGEDEEDGLEGVLGVVPVAQELSADAQDHRPVARHERGEGGIPGRIAAGGEPLQELAVGQTGDRAALEERLDLPANRLAAACAMPLNSPHRDLGLRSSPQWIVPRRRSFIPGWAD